MPELRMNAPVAMRCGRCPALTGSRMAFSFLLAKTLLAGSSGSLRSSG
jgi:hypothetical protein